jgi:hypothetical protein
MRVSRLENEAREPAGEFISLQLKGNVNERGATGSGALSHDNLVAQMSGN